MPANPQRHEFLKAKGAARPTAPEPRLLIRAIRVGDESQTRRLLGFGADPNARNQWGQTALAVAALGDQAGCLVALIEFGASIDAPCQSSGRSPLMSAAWSGSMECLQALIERGASASQLDKEGWNALMWAAKADAWACAVELSARCDVLALDAKGLSAADLAPPNGRCRPYLLTRALAAVERSELASVAQARKRGLP
jgi:hypothetical protein